MNHNTQYENSRLDSDLTWAILDIDEADDAYDERTNTIRVKFSGGKKFRVFLAYTGVFVNPDYRRFKCITFHNSSVQGFSEDAVMHGVGFLIDGVNFGDKQIESVSNPSARVSAPGVEDEKHDITIQGSDNVSISIGENRILFKVGQNELILADNGTILTGEMHKDSPDTRSSMLKANPISDQMPLASFCVLPLPPRLPNFDLIDNTGGIISSLHSLSSLV
jgi:hypothetical protein